MTGVMRSVSAPDPRIFGRHEAIDDILALLRQVRLVSVVGAGGIGKTTVAGAAAALLRDEFRDGVYWIDLAPLSDPSLIAYAVANTLGLAIHSADILPALCRALSDQHLLLVLDNCEHLAPAVAVCIVEILSSAKDVCILTTSREPLKAPGERVCRLEGLATPASQDISAAEALEYPAVRLFVERAADRLETFGLSDGDTPALIALCQDLDGIALAIELAAMRVDAFGVAGLRRQLKRQFRLLGERRAGLDRHRTLGATLDWSFGLLPPDQALVLCSVAAFAGVFSSDDAAAVSGMESAAVEHHLAELAAKSLLAGVAATGGTRYRLLDTTRAYCREKLRLLGEEGHVRDRHARYITGAVEAAGHEHERRSSTEWGASFGDRLGDLRLALDWAAAEQSRSPILVRLTAGGLVFWNHYSLTNECSGHVRRAIATIAGTDLAGSATEMELQIALAGAVLYTGGVVPEARAALEAALDTARRLPDRHSELRCLRMLGTYQLFSGETYAGMATLRDFVALASEIDPEVVAEGETHLGVGELFVGQLDHVVKRLALLDGSGLRDLEDTRSLRFFYNNSVNILIVLCHAQWLTGSPGAAESTATKVMHYSRETNHELSMSIGLAWVCLLEHWTGRHDQCLAHTKMLEDLIGRHGIEIWRPVASFCRGAIAAARDDTLAEGVELLRRAVLECREIGHMARLPYYTGVLAEALARSGAFDEAETVLDEAMALSAHQDENWCMPELLRIRGIILGARGSSGSQEASLLQSISLAEESGALSWRLRSANDLARLWRKRGEGVRASAILLPIYAAFTDGFETADLIISRVILGL